MTFYLVSFGSLVAFVILLIVLGMSGPRELKRMRNRRRREQEEADALYWERANKETFR